METTKATVTLVNFSSVQADDAHACCMALTGRFPRCQFGTADKHGIWSVTYTAKKYFPLDPSSTMLEDNELEKIVQSFASGFWYARHV